MKTTRLFASTAAGVLAITMFGFVGTATAAERPSPAAIAATAVDGELADNLAFMREEERLARDLYTLFAERYPEATVFANIATSEQRHFDAVGRQLDTRGLDDPSDGLDPGEYAYDELDELYAGWSAQGATLEGALQAGIDLEEADIADLERILGLDSSDPVERVLSALLAGSRNHLAAFTSALENGGVCADCGQGDQSQKAMMKRFGSQDQQGNQDGRQDRQGNQNGGQRMGRGLGSATCDGSGATR